MKTISRNYGPIKLEIKHSTFIAYSYLIKNKSDLKEILSQIKGHHSKATHIVYAARYYDSNQLYETYYEDGEPSNTAGKAIYNRLLKQLDIINVLVVVVRYKNGPLLGSGLLSRAYLKAALGVCNTELLIDYINYYSSFLTIPISQYEQFKSYAHHTGINISKTMFNETEVYLEIQVPRTVKIDPKWI